MAAAAGVVDVLPVVRGRAIVPRDAGYDRIIAGAPNHLGRVECAGVPNTVHLWDPALAPHPGGPVVVVGDGAEVAGIEERTRHARYLAKRLCQFPGVVMPWVPETPVAIVMLPFDPPPALPSLGPGFAGIPAALRLVVEPGATSHTVAAYAAALETELERGGRE
jgi:hypothetical protein